MKQSMTNSTNYYFFLFLKVYALTLLLSPFVQSAFSLNELVDIYPSPQGLGMGNALTADATGYQAIFYNPAGVANQPKRKWEVNLLDLQGGLALNSVSHVWTNQSFGPDRMWGELKHHPGNYQFLNAASLPSVTVRGLSISLIGSYRFAALSDGSTIDTDLSKDVGVAFAVGRSFGGNILKLGLTTKALIRNQMKGQFSHDTLAGLNDSSFPSLFKEGWAVGFDLGMLVTLPEKFLPTLGIVWKDAFDTHFKSSNILNSQATGKPDPINQSVNAALSIHPIFSPRLKSTIALEYKHLELPHLQFRKHLHVGFQLEHIKEVYFWAGLYQLYPTAGFGYRVKGGNLELVTYAVDVGDGNENQENRRFSFRYTISF
ncbi:hypothetical protein EBQ74_02640 [bacterium]|nr:hypothetical protein [bacterium]